jgi:hypothetical protein
LSSGGLFIGRASKINIYQKTLKLKRLLEVQINPSQPFKTQENETHYKKMKQNV